MEESTGRERESLLEMRKVSLFGNGLNRFDTFHSESNNVVKEMYIGSIISEESHVMKLKEQMSIQYSTVQ